MFILHTPNSQRATSILIKKQLSDGPFKESLGVKILPTHWVKEKERAEIKGVDKATSIEYKSINILLDNIQKYIDARIIDARYTGNHLTSAELREQIRGLTGKKKSSKGSKFYTQCRDAIIKDMISGVLLTPKKNPKRYSEGTIRCYQQTLDTLEAYNPGLTWAMVDIKFYWLFIKWCNDKDWSMNYIGQHLKNLVRLMKIGKSKSYQFHNSIGYLDEDFKYISEETDDIALTQAELTAIANKNIPNKRWDMARDWFVIGAYLGLRVSDVKLLNKEMNFATNVVMIANEKTDTKVVVPINNCIRAIMKKWGGLPPKMADSEINQHIKKVSEIVGLTEPFLYSLTKGGARRDFYLRKCDMVSCHTMRRFFITELLRLHIPDNQVMQLAGIKKHTTLLRYKKTTAEENAQNMQGKAFFK